MENGSEFERGDEVYCELPGGAADGPYTVSFTEGTVTFVKAASGTVLVLPTYRLRMMPPLRKRARRGGAKTRPYPAV